MTVILSTDWISAATNLGAISCSQTEIQALETAIGFSLPSAYIQNFLIPLGKGAGVFLQGEDCFYDQLLDLQSGARELLLEEKFPEVLPADAFVFWMHQGYQFAFFRIGEGEDPPVYHFEEGQESQTFQRIHDRLSDFLRAEWTLFEQWRGANPV
jgi:hypothetical protein